VPGGTAISAQQLVADGAQAVGVGLLLTRTHLDVYWYDH
jgi:hypothetical protein